MPPRAWSTYHFSIVLLTEFVQAITTGAISTLNGTLDALLTAAYANLANEKTDLLEMIEFRPGVMAEALAQSRQHHPPFPRRIVIQQGYAPQHRVSGAGRASRRPIRGDVLQESLPATAAVATLARVDAADRRARPCVIPQWTRHRSLHDCGASEGNCQPHGRRAVCEMTLRIGWPTELPATERSWDCTIHLIAQQDVMTAIDAFTIFEDCPTVGSLITNAQAEWNEFKT